MRIFGVLFMCLFKRLGKEWLLVVTIPLVSVCLSELSSLMGGEGKIKAQLGRVSGEDLT